MERWQLKNLNAIVWLYRGEIEKYQNLLAEYRAVLGSMPFEDTLAQLKAELKDLQKRTKLEVEQADRKDKKRIQAEYDEQIASKTEELTIAKEAVWLYEKFGEGEYRDVLGLCKVECSSVIIEEKGCSLTPGAYVGVAPVEDDGVDFEERMAEIHRELISLQAESNDLMDTISKNMKEMGM